MTFHTLIPLESFTVETLLGFRFIDAATESPVREGLEVTARLDAATGPRIHATRTRSGYYAFHGLPGLRAHEYPNETLPPPESPPDGTTWLTEVVDRRGRYTPAVRRVTLPLSAVDSPPSPGSPPDISRLLDFYLFSAPARTAPPGFAAVRAHLFDAASRRPAPHAVLDVEAEGARWYGISDEEGRVAVFFPYPSVEITLTGSPPSGQMPLHAQAWDLTVRVRYEPEALVIPPGAGYPELGSLFGQERGLLYPADPDASPAPTPAAALTQVLRYREDSVLRTEGDPVLFIEPNPSSP